MKLTIINAYYIDQSGDGKENDIIADYNLFVTISKRLKQDYRYSLHTKMALPSGYSFEYEFIKFIPKYDGLTIQEIDDTFTEYFKIRIIFWDHALESGWYKLTTGIELSQWGQQIYGEMTMEFDPPTDGSGDTPPPPLVTDW